MVKKLGKIVKKIVDPKERFLYFRQFGVYNYLSDKDYCTKAFRLVLGEDINWDNPQTFNQKLQWLKLYDRRPEFTIMVDKYRVRQYISEQLGDEYLIPLLGVYDNPEEIDFESLPQRFVLKCNHNSGKGMYICRDKKQLNPRKVKAELYKGLKENYYSINREYPYKNVPRKIIAETFMYDENSGDLDSGLIDYKFYCFNGIPKLLYVSQGLENHDTAKISFLNIDWTFADFGRSDYKAWETLPKKPQNYENMLEIAKKLSKGIPFLRVDLYEINNKIYFGELTFSPCAGMMPFVPRQADLEVGKLLDITHLKKEIDIL